MEFNYDNPLNLKGSVNNIKKIFKEKGITMGLFEPKVVNEIKVVVIDGVPNINKGMMVDLQAWSDRLYMCIDGRRDISCEVPYSKITNIGHFSESELTSQNKSVVGRAAVGGLLLGPLGAIVGGMSGVNGSKMSYKTYLVVNYRDNFGEIQAISFGILPSSKSFYEFEHCLKTKSGVEAQKNVCL